MTRFEPLSRINRIRRFFGLCPHWWSDWQKMYSASTDPIPFMADDSVEIGNKRSCHLCGHTQYHRDPEGH